MRSLLNKRIILFAAAALYGADAPKRAGEGNLRIAEKEKKLSGSFTYQVNMNVGFV